ncbi:MAG: hypothetical protein R3A44_28530 [Caldilineaceae bacterium]
MILPGATIGVFGSGQLGRMLRLAARPMGYRFAVFAPDAEDSPAGDVADWVVQLIMPIWRQCAVLPLGIDRRNV